MVIARHPMRNDGEFRCDCGPPIPDGLAGESPGRRTYQGAGMRRIERERVDSQDPISAREVPLLCRQISPRYLPRGRCPRRDRFGWGCELLILSRVLPLFENCLSAPLLPGPLRHISRARKEPERSVRHLHSSAEHAATSKSRASCTHAAYSWRASGPGTAAAESVGLGSRHRSRAGADKPAPAGLPTIGGHQVRTHSRDAAHVLANPF